MSAEDARKLLATVSPHRSLEHSLYVKKIRTILSDNQ